MEDICYGYLDNAALIGDTRVASKCKQLTIAQQSRLSGPAPSFVSDTTVDLIKWGHTTGKRFLFIQSFGHITTSGDALRDVIDDLANDSLVSCMGYNNHHERRSTAFLLDLKNVRIGYKDFPDYFELTSYYLNPMFGTKSFSMALDDFCAHGQSLDWDDQYSFLARYYCDPNAEPYGVTIQDSEPYRSEHTHGRSINQLYTVASGFKPILLLANKGFTPSTRVVYYDNSDIALVFRRVMVETWDGINFPRFVDKLATKDHFQVTRDSNAVQRAWEDTLAQCGGEREFKTIWDKYRKLNHKYIITDLLQLPCFLYDSILNDPQSYIFWDDCFSTNTAHLQYPIEHLAQKYQAFYGEVLSRCPLITMDGRDHWGRRAINHIRQNNKY